MTTSPTHAERPLPAIGINAVAVPIDARVGAPSSFYVMDGQSFAYLPVVQPSYERAKIYRTRGRK